MSRLSIKGLFALSVGLVLLAAASGWALSGTPVNPAATTAGLDCCAAQLPCCDPPSACCVGEECCLTASACCETAAACCVK